MKSSMTEIEFREALKGQVEQAGSQAALARHLGVSPQYLGDVIAGHRPPGESVLGPMGYERVTTYRKKELKNGKASKG